MRRWLKRLKSGFAGLLTWIRIAWPFVFLWAAVLLGAVLAGCSIAQVWIILTLGTCLMIAEMLNTAIERLCDVVEPHYNDTIGAIKDICAGAVLVSGLALIVVGAWIILDLGRRLLE